MSTSPFTPITLNGVSKYSSDFQSILNRAVQIAQIPVTALQNKDSELLQQKTLLSTLNTSVSALASSLTSLLGGLAGYRALKDTLTVLPYAISVAAASLISVAVADLIPGLHRRVDPAGSAMQVLLIGAGVAVIAVAEVGLG